MRSTRLALPALLVASLFGCRMTNPAFDDGSVDELGHSEDTELDSKADATEDESGSSVGEEASNEGESSSSDGNEEESSSSDGNEEESSSSDGNEGESSSGDSESSSGDSESSSGESDTFDTLDGPIGLCSLIEPAATCFQCMQNQCCEEGNVGCFDGLDPTCACLLDCLLDGNNDEAFCHNKCDPDLATIDKVDGLLECGVNSCMLCG